MDRKKNFIKYFLPVWLLFPLACATPYIKCHFTPHFNSFFTLSSSLKVVPPGTAITGGLLPYPGVTHDDLMLKNKLEQALLSKGFNVKTEGDTEYEFHFIASKNIYGHLLDFAGNIVNSYTRKVAFSVDLRAIGDLLKNNWTASVAMKKVADEIY